MSELRKNITYFGAPRLLVCDGRCDKAWGINNRPQLYFQESLLVPRALEPGEEPRDPDDYVFVGDEALSIAPGDPGTYEGGEGKPSATPLDDSSRMNRWCVRECERSRKLKPGELVTLRDLVRPRPNRSDRPIPMEPAQR